MTFPPISLGMIGPRGFGAFCAEAYLEAGLITLAALAGRDQSNLDTLAARFGTPKTYTDWREMVQDPAVEAVHIVTPPDCHAAMAVAALNAGKHVFIEKPLATTLDDSRMILDAAAASGKVAGINYVMRYDPLYQTVQSIRDGGWLGELTHVGFENYASDEGLDDGHWFWDPLASGGIFVEHGVHFFDIIGAIAGAPVQDVVGKTWVRGDGTGKEDRVQALVTYENGVDASFYHAFNRPGALERQTAQFAFERGHLTLHGWIPTSLSLSAIVDEAGAAGLSSVLTLEDVTDDAFPATVRGNGKDLVVTRRVRAAQTLGEPTPVYRQAVKDAFTDFSRGIREPGYVPRVTVEDGAASLATAIAARDSARGF